MKAIIFGGIGTIANTSFLQRKAFNRAFEQLSVNWHWGESEYRILLIQPGGEARISRYNEQYGGLPDNVTPSQVHKLKTSLFHDFMNNAKLSLRPGVEWVLKQSKLKCNKVAFATTTSRNNVDVLLNAVGLPRCTFDIISDSSLVKASKPAPEVYQYCLDKMGISASSCLAIEDAKSGVAAAVNAGLTCLAFPNEYTVDHDYGDAAEKIDDLKKSMQLCGFFGVIEHRYT